MLRLQRCREAKAFVILERFDRSLVENTDWFLNGLDMDWDGHGLAMDWEWIGHGLGTYLRLGLDLQGVFQDPDQGVHDLST